MTAREYMEQVTYIEKRINSKMDNVERLESIINRTTPIFSETRGSSRDVMNREKSIARMADMKKELENDIVGLITLKMQISDVISHVDDDALRLLLELRYVNMYTWSDVAMMMNINKRTVYRMHEKALGEIEKKYGKKLKLSPNVT